MYNFAAPTEKRCSPCSWSSGHTASVSDAKIRILDKKKNINLCSNWTLFCSHITGWVSFYGHFPRIFRKLWLKSYCLIQLSLSSELKIKVASGSRLQGNGARCLAIFWRLALIRKSPSSADAIIFFGIGFSFCRNQLVDSPIPLDSVAISMCMFSSDYY